MTASNPSIFRHVLGHYPTGVCLITATAADATPVGMVVGSFTSVSLDPPLVAFFPAKSSTTWPKIAAAGAFCVNVLSDDHEALTRRFTSKAHDAFERCGYRQSATGSPILADVVAWIDCTLDAVHDAGDHFIALGRVEQLDADPSRNPLLFCKGAYAGVSVRQMLSE